ncbi:Transcription factor Aft1, HRA domain protein [Metarhizium guizhouense ARSEF 977]|uniref:Transcription factor Aft1, HRA domain protein n=1 Tax=Metarhizium guizhouense (strain ARSEF 977) TaxID=1276136 RepID=A0A0B4I4P2_METGA|nr:Transcription factor Aft1, HRA domain protein [Metarhizium guizhouense ARSEF 977]
MGTSPGTESKSPKFSNNKTLRQGEPHRIVPFQAPEFRPFYIATVVTQSHVLMSGIALRASPLSSFSPLSQPNPPLLELQNTVQVRCPTTRRRSHPCSHAFLILDTASDSKVDPAAVKPDGASNAEATKPLAPPPRPGQQPQGNNTPDYFSGQGGGSLSLEPNPFEQSFGGGGGPETPGGTKLPSVAALTSPSSLLPVNTPFTWGGGSLRTGPLSPAMLSGPANDYFSDAHHLRGGFPTPNESSLRSGLTPGGSGSMFPAPSPNSQALFAQLASGGATPSTIDFHRTAMSAAAAKREQGQPQTQSQQVTSQPADMPNGATPTVKAEPKQASGPFDPHDNDAANGLFMLAQGAQTRNGNQPSSQFPTSSAPSHAHPAPAPAQTSNTSPQMSTGNAASRGGSEGTNGSEEPEQAKPAAKGKGKKATAAASNGRRKADDTPAKAPPNKKSKGNAGAADGMSPEVSDEEDDDMGDDPSSKTKMTDEEKRKNFLERNRVAALKCRQRKKQWLANLQNKVEMYSSENDALTAQITQLREEVVNLKTLLLAHKDCPVTQQQGLHGTFMSGVVEPFNTQMNPYGMAGPMPNQQVMAGQSIQRRFS